ncbi:MAG: DUF6252 family protein [Flavobacterium sp.]|nr:DUF6252 family protein [Flavobacterium sp.]
MKKIQLLAVLFISVLFASCSSSDDGGSSSAEDYFHYKLDGTDIELTTITAIRSGDSFEVLGQTAAGTSMYFSFNQYGDLNRAGNTPDNISDVSWKNSAYEFSSHYFNFELVSIDAANKKVKINYSGKLYEDEFDLDSAFSTVEGSLYVTYTDVVPQVAGLGVAAKIAGQDWHAVKSSTSISNGLSSIIENSDDEYQLSFYVDENTAVGNYTFNAASQDHKVVLSKYNTTTNEYVDYVGSGSITITENTSGIGYSLIVGTYSFTATNPNDNSQIQVTNGTIKEVYSF